MLHGSRPTSVVGMTSRRTRAALLTTATLTTSLTLGCGASEQPTETGTTGKTTTVSDWRPRLAPQRPPLEGGSRIRGLDSTDPMIANLDPHLLDAVQAAARAAHADGVPLSVTSGWRSREHQQRLFDEAVAEYGSVKEASRWVSTPDTSAHVTGDAVDVGPTEAADWLSRHGTDHGLCQVFANELWHYELATTPGGECPPPYPDSSYREQPPE
jgi:zinc D-Ala-D-Ala carboxypeptidase